MLCWIFTIIISIAIAYQDFKAREISLILIVGYGTLSALRYIQENNLSLFLNNLFFTAGYLLFLLLFITIYFYLRRGKWINIIDAQIGVGDILLFICIGCCLEPLELLIFFTNCFIFSLICYGLFFRGKSVPLAGLSAVFYLMFYPIKLYLINFLP